MTNSNIENLIKEGFFLKAVYQDQLDYFQKTSQFLWQNSFVKEGFGHSIISREQQFPTGLKTRHVNVAIPHTDNGFINKDMIIVSLFENPIVFNRMDNAQEQLNVNISFMLLLSNPTNQIVALQELVNLFQKDSFPKVITAETKDEFLMTVSEVLHHDQTDDL